MACLFEGEQIFWIFFGDCIGDAYDRWDYDIRVWVLRILDAFLQIMQGHGKVKLTLISCLLTHVNYMGQNQIPKTYSFVFSIRIATIVTK